MRETNGQFKQGHIKVGGFTKGSVHTEDSKAKISASLRDMTGDQARRWKGIKAGYHAIHCWLSKHYEKGDNCEQCGTREFSRLEWANLSGEYKRERSDYKAMCPSCHRLFDGKNKCRKGHDYKPETTHYNSRGHRTCLICKEAKYATAY